MKIFSFIQYLIFLFYLFVLGILWGGYIAGEVMPLGWLIFVTIIVAVRVLMGYWEIKED